MAGGLLINGLEVDGLRGALLHGEPLDLTRGELVLLHALAKAPDRVHSKDDLLSTVRGRTPIWRSTRDLDSTACRLRAKLARDGDRFVCNVWGVGYRLTDAAAARVDVAP